MACAPLILLAQNRQENRDRVTLEEDRRRASQTKADTEFLARELAALRLAVGEVVTREYLRDELEELRDLLADLLPQSHEKPGREGAQRGAGRQEIALNVKSTIAPLPSRELCMVI